MPKLFEEDLIGAKIMEAFLGPHSTWRTAGGIARDSGLTTDEVRDYISTHQDYFVQPSLTLGGTPVYTVHENLRANLSALKE